MINLTTLQLKISAYEFYLVINYSYLSFWSVESFPLLHKTSKFFCGCFIRSSNSSFSFEEVNNLKVWEKIKYREQWTWKPIQSFQISYRKKEEEWNWDHNINKSERWESSALNKYPVMWSWQTCWLSATLCWASACLRASLSCKT